MQQYLISLILTYSILGTLGYGIRNNTKRNNMIEVFKWKQLEFDDCNDENILKTGHNREYEHIFFPGLASRHGIIQPQLHAEHYNDHHSINMRNCIGSNFNGEEYVPYNNVPIGVTHYKNLLIVTVPRRRSGIPSTLNYIDLKESLKSSNQSPKLRAYPNLAINQFKNKTNGLVSVYRTSVDDCGRLWFVDTGMLEYPGNFQQIQRPAIWIWDIERNEVIHRFEIAESIASIGRGMASITIDCRQKHSCDDAFAYIPDLINRKLHVYSLTMNRIWSFTHMSFNPDPLAGNITVAGQNFRWDDGIFSITLGPQRQDGIRDVFYHAMQSNNEFVVSNHILQIESNAAREDHGGDFRLVGSRGLQKQSTMHEYDPLSGVIFYSEVNRNGVGCWNTKYEFSAENHGNIASDNERMIYPSDLTIDNEGTIWLMTNSMPIFIYSRLDPDNYNFRIWKQTTIKAKRNTICD